MALKEEVASRVERRMNRLFGDDAFDDADINDVVEEAELGILNYCNLRSVPRELLGVWANLAIDVYRWERSLAETLSGESGEAKEPKLASIVTGITEGDASLSLAVDASSDRVRTSSAHDASAGVDGVVLNYRDQLNRFRRIVW